MKEQNPDVTAWLSVPGLELSLPVVQNEDSNYYLRRSFSGASSNDGCLIRPSWDSTSWADGLCHVIHGHNIHNGAMFGKLDAYRKQDFTAQTQRLPCTRRMATTCAASSRHTMPNRTTRAMRWITVRAKITMPFCGI